MKLMNKLKVTIFLVLVLFETGVLIIAASFINNEISTAAARQSDAYNTSYRESYANSYDNAYQVSYDDTYRSSYDEQYRATYDEQYKNSYDEEYALEYESQYKTSYDDKYNSAYNIQYNKSYTESYAKGNEEGSLSGLEQGNIDGLKTIVSLHDPTYQELMTFLTADPTDQNAYDAIKYNCFDYSADLDNDAERAGINAGFVIITFPQEPGHAITVFQTTDRGLVFIEPQNDSVVNLVKGKHYYLSVVPPPGYYYPPPSYNDTVVNYKIIW